MNLRIKENLLKVFKIFLYTFATVGFVFVAVFFAMQFNLLNVKGSISERNSYFNFNKNDSNSLNSGNVNSGENNDASLRIICQINVLSKYAPITAIDIYKTMEQGTNSAILDQMIRNAIVRFSGDNLFVKNINNCTDLSNTTNNTNTVKLPMSAYAWADTEEWNLMKEVFTRDQDIIKKAAQDAQISPRILLGGVIGEQFRFFSSRRESFKSYFEPLKILASLSKMSFGIAGLKPQTISLIEEYLKDQNSVFYLGSEMEHIVDYAPNANIEAEQMNRITDAKNPYYSYLYVGLYMRQVAAQWDKAGYNINNRPEILATLYNLGFPRSIPKENAAAGGAVINVGGIDYTFGDLAYEFYYSGELADIFPLINK